MKVLKWLDNNIEELLMTLLLVGITVVMIAQVIARYVFQSPLTWSDELARYFLVWSGFLSVSYCVKRRISIKIEQFQNALPKPAIPWIKMLRHTILFLFCLIMLPYAWEYVRQTVSSGATSPAMLIPMVYIQSAPLVGFLLLTVREVQAWVREFKASRRYMAKVLKEELATGELSEETREGKTV